MTQVFPSATEGLPARTRAMAAATVAVLEIKAMASSSMIFIKVFGVVRCGQHGNTAPQRGHRVIAGRLLHVRLYRAWDGSCGNQFAVISSSWP